MFLTKDFIENYCSLAKEIKIDGRPLTDLNKQEMIAISAYFYHMYMKVRKHVPTEELFPEDKTKKAKT